MENTSGYRPLDFRVLVKLPPKEEVTKGGIIKPPEVLDKEKHNFDYGLVVAVGHQAFDYMRFPDRGEPTPEGLIPKIGDIVTFVKYAGQPLTGEDKADYRVMNDKEVYALKMEQAA